MYPSTPPSSAEADDPPDVVAEGHGVVLDGVGDGLVQQVGDQHLEDQAEERQHQRGDEDALVGPHDGHGPAQPRLGDVSGSMAAGGASLRAASAMGTNGGAGLGRPVGRGPQGRGPHRPPPGRAVGDEGRSPAARGPEGPRRRGSSRQPVMSHRRPSRAASAAAQHPVALGGQDVVDPAAVGGDGAPLDQAPGHQAVDDGGDAGGPDGQALGQGRGDGRALVEQAQHPVLGEGQVDGVEAELHLLGQPGGGAPQGRRSRRAVAWQLLRDSHS